MTSCVHVHTVSRWSLRDWRIDIAQEPDARLAGKTSVSEDELDLVIATWKFKGEPRELTVRQAITMSSSLKSAKGDDGKYAIPSADEALNAVRGSSMVEEAENRGFSPSDKELLTYAEEMLGLSPDFEEIAKSSEMSVEQVYDYLYKSYMTSKLIESIVGEYPTFPESPEIKDMNDLTQEEKEALDRYNNECVEVSKQIDARGEQLDAELDKLYAESISDVRI